LAVKIVIVFATMMIANIYANIANNFLFN